MTYTECDCSTKIPHRAIIICLQHRKQDICGHKFKDDSEVEKNCAAMVDNRVQAIGTNSGYSSGQRL